MAQMEAATEGWSPDNILGEGGYAVVYKGVSPKGHLWAVKRAKVMTNDFEAEVSEHITEGVRAPRIRDPHLS